MKLQEIAELLKARVLSSEHMLETEVQNAFCCDMMSDVLAFATNQSVLITGLLNPQVVRTAMMLDMHCIVFINGKEPTPEIVSLADANDIVIMVSDESMFRAAGRLFDTGLLNTEEE
jgi:predicted transcriptional regulator